MPRRRCTIDDPTPPPPKVEGVARLWLSANGMVVVRTPFDRPTAAMLAALPKESRTWDAADRVWRCVPDLLPAVREIVAGRFERVIEDPAVAEFVEGRRKANERAVLGAVRREFAGADVVDLDAVRRRVRGGAA